VLAHSSIDQTLEGSCLVSGLQGSTLKVFRQHHHLSIEWRKTLLDHGQYLIDAEPLSDGVTTMTGENPKATLIVIGDHDQRSEYPGRSNRLLELGEIAHRRTGVVHRGMKIVYVKQLQGACHRLSSLCPRPR
jgi:hypothetical protein